MWIALTLICICCFFIYLKLRLPIQYWKNKHIPHPTPSIVFGNLGPVVSKKVTYPKHLQDTCNKFGNHRYFGFYHFSQPTLVVQDIELIKQICIKKFDHFMDHFDFLPKDVDTFWQKGLFAREGEDWHNMRVTISPAFTSKKMKAMFYLVNECCENIMTHFKKENSLITLDIMDAFTKLTTDMIASCTFGIHCDSLKNENNEFYVMAKKAFTFTGLKSFIFFGKSFSVTLSRLLKLKMFDNDVRDFFVRITKETIDYRKKTGLYRPDVIHLLMEAQKGNLKLEEDDDNLTSGFSGIDESYSTKSNPTKKYTITDEDIASQALIFFFGSYDTVTTALCHTIYELVANMDAQEKLINEIDYTLKQCNGKITYEAIFKMKYLDMVISETLRLWPPAFILNRICVKPFIIESTLPHEKSLLVEKGTEIIVPAYAIHRNPKYYKNPDKFDPERFIKDEIRPFTYFPFGIGPRFCIGNRFALMVIKLAIVNLLSNFRVVPVKKTILPFELSNSFTLRSAHGYWFGFQPRTDK